MNAIVVGVGRTTDDAVLDWAAAEAGACGAPLTVVHVPPASAPQGPDGPVAALRERVAAAVARAGAEVPTTVEVLPGRSVADVLVGVAADASAVVIGRRTVRGPRTLGRVTTAVVEGAAAPVTVVPHDRPAPADGPRPVVVGVDGSAPAVAALRYAAGVAARADLPLEVVLAWQMRTLAPLPGKEWGYTPPLDDYARHARTLLDGALEAADVHLPDARLVRSVVHGTATNALLEAAPRADRLVVGRRGLSGVDRILLGSVSRQVVARARCPVTVVH
ncbi:universal stress protein [Cellulomonas shaoxiangyii]|uniref:Universal stress protein n=2 Tax=Cellulomonas shaoxiangyii TaxID=2566013 RepID=A0A4P7SLV3_9CELL|nr:universal stress protein [Cellulomonas shaoxiangyii]TGY78804.1 universal stress protein [Cellulomonas shaoxiangyii]